MVLPHSLLQRMARDVIRLANIAGGQHEANTVCILLQSLVSRRAAETDSKGNYIGTVIVGEITTQRLRHDFDET
jgi:hypothetical protein